MADYKGLNIRFQANATDASKALHILGTEAKNAQGNLSRVQDALRNTKTNGDALNATLKQMQLEQLGKQADVARQKFEAYRDSIPQLKDKLAEARAEIESTKAAMEGGEVKLFKDDGTAMNMKELAAHLNAVEEEERKVAASVESATVNMNAQKSAVQALDAQYSSMSASLAASQTALGQFGANAQEFGSNLQNAGNALSSIGDKMTIVSGIAAMTFGRNIVSSTEEFGNAISQLGGYLDIQGAQLDEMSDQALKWGKDTQFSATEAAQAMNELAKGGMTQAQISGGAMEATMQLAAAGELDMASAAETAVQAIKTFGLTAEDSSAIADALAGAANKSTAEVTDLAQGFKYVGGWASMANWNINDVSGALALLSDHGLRGEMAGTALRNVMQRLAAPTDTAAQLMEQYGFSVRDSSGQMVSAVEMVQRLNDVFGQLGDQERQEVLSKIFGARALPAAIALMDEGADSLQGYIDATTQVGYAGEMAQNRMGELGWALEMLRGEAETAAVNFGTALTPTIVEVAGAIENALTWFNSLSDAEKTQIANMALMVAAAGPVMSIVGHLASGIGGFVSMTGECAENISTFVVEMREMHEAGLLGANAIEGVVGTLEAVGPAIAVVAAAWLATDLIGQFMDYVAAADEMKMATEGLHSAVENMTAGVQSSGISDSVRSLEEIRDASRALASEQADLADSMREAMGESGKSVGMLETYASTIEELTSRSSLNRGEQERLQQAVEGFNSIAGTSISIIDAQTGALNTNASSIREVIAAYKDYAQAQATLNAYSKVQEQIIDNQIEIKRLNDELGKADKGVGWYIGDFAVFSDFGGVADRYHELEKSMSDAQSRSKELAFAQNELSSMIDNASSSADGYNAVLKNLGIAAKDSAETTKTAGADVEDFGETVSSGIDTASKAAQKAQKRANDAIYREQQRAYDAEYKALQKALGAAYKEQQKAFDKEYKACQKTYDSEYKELQKKLDKEYSAYQKSYDKEYKERQKQLDRQYDEYKKTLDAEESALKKSLDAKTDALKKQLDAELKAVKKANDARLKEQKKADEAETKAFKAETDKRVAALQAEYKARLKNLESQYGGSDIDAQIKDLKNQTQAEQDEIKRRAQTEKKAELEKAVEQAKTRRKRADAEKALNEYLEELAQEQREKEREAQIERLEEQKDALKDELEAKKDALKEETDNRIAALKESRSAELDAIKEANDAETEVLKEQLDAVYQTRKDANDLKLQQLKDANQIELDALKEHHATLLEGMKEQHSLELEQLKEQQQEQLEAIKEGHQLQLENLKEYQQEQLDALKESQTAQLDAMREAQQEQLEALKQSQQDQLQALRDSLDDQLEALQSGGSAMVGATQDANNQMVDSTESTTQQIKQSIDDRVRASREKLDQAAKDAQGGMAKISGNFTGALDILQPKVNTKVGLMHDYARDKLTNIATVSGQKGNEAGDNLYNALRNKTSYVEGAAQSMANGAESPFRNFPSAVGGKGSEGSYSFAEGIRDGGSTAKSNAQSIADDVEDALSAPSKNSDSWGWDMMHNFNESMVRYWNNTLSRNISNIGTSIKNMFGHSTPKEGPMKGDDQWFYHFMQNLDGGLKRGTPMLMDTVNTIAEGVSGAMNADFVDNLVDGMRSKESELATQSRRMAEIVNDEFNPYASAEYSIGYDARPMAKMLTSGVTEALRSGIPQRQGATIIVKEMRVRDESDIRRVSQRLYQLEEQTNRRGL